MISEKYSIDRSHRKDIQKNLVSSGTGLSRASKILWLMVESGLVYAIILANLVLFFASSRVLKVKVNR